VIRIKLLLHPDLLEGKATLASLQYYEGKTCCLKTNNMVSLLALDKVEEVSAHSVASHTDETDQTKFL